MGTWQHMLNISLFVLFSIGKQFKNMLKEAEIVIAEGKEEYRQGITTEFEFAGFMRESKELVNDLKEVIKNYSSHIDTTEDFIYLYEESNE